MHLHRYGPHFLLVNSTTAVSFWAEGQDEPAWMELCEDLRTYGLILNVEWPAECGGVPGYVTYYHHVGDGLPTGGTEVEFLDEYEDALSFLLVVEGVSLRVNARWDILKKNLGGLDDRTEDR